MWSSYDKLQVNFDDWINPTTSEKSLVSERDYENSYIVRTGAEYKATKNLALRAGIFYDKNPVKDKKLDATLPDADRIGFNLGFGYNFTKNFSIDVAYLYLNFVDRTIDNSSEFLPISNPPVYLDGKYESNANLLAINFNYNF